jgi:hypothetical protein
MNSRSSDVDGTTPSGIGCSMRRRPLICARDRVLSVRVAPDQCEAHLVGDCELDLGGLNDLKQRLHKDLPPKRGSQRNTYAPARGRASRHLEGAQFVGHERAEHGVHFAL